MASKFRKGRLPDGVAYKWLDSQIIPFLKPDMLSGDCQVPGPVERGFVVRASVLERDNAFLWIQYSDDKLCVVDDLSKASIFQSLGDADAFIDEIIKREGAFDWKEICKGVVDGYMAEGFTEAAIEVARACLERLLFEGALGYRSRRIVMP